MNPGLCRDCKHSRRLESSRGSVFFMCQLAESDAKFPRYPRLPVAKCEGYEKSGAESGRCFINLATELL